MEHEHPAELAQIKAGKHAEPVSEEILRKRKRIFVPIAIVILAAFGLGFYYFVGYETTAIINPIPTLPIYVPQTTIPLPTATLIP